MNQEIFWVLFSKKITGEINPAEREQLEKMIWQHPEWHFAIQNIEELWDTEQEVDLRKAEEAYMNYMNRLKEKELMIEEHGSVTTSKRFQSFAGIKRIFYYSLGVAVSSIVIFFLVKNLNIEKPSIVTDNNNEISTRDGSKSKIQLPDGSVVWLNAGSRLTYDKDFGKKNREASLSGEAYFDIVKNSDHPFILHTSNIDIMVLGTTFNVKAHPEDKTTETSLIRGEIEVSLRNRPHDKIILTPNEKLIVENIPHENTSVAKPVNKTESTVIISQVKYNNRDSTINEIQWVQNKLVFEDETFQEIALKMQRWYNVEITIEDKKLKERRYTGSFQNENIDQAMEALKFHEPFKSEKKGNKIILNP